MNNLHLGKVFYLLRLAEHIFQNVISDAAFIRLHLVELDAVAQQALRTSLPRALQNAYICVAVCFGSNRHLPFGVEREGRRRLPLGLGLPV